MINIHQVSRQVTNQKIPIWLNRHVSIQIPPGKIIGLVGPNGAGKTTLMRLIAGLDALTEGEISIDGTVVQSASSSVGYLNEQAGLYRRLTVLENLLYQATLYHLPAKMANDRIEEIASVLDIKGLLQKQADKLSRGETMSALLARTLIHNPKYLLLDEPTNGLDLSAVIHLRRFLKSLCDKKHGILISSHAMYEVEKLADYLVIINQGKVLLQGTTPDICIQTQTNNLEAAFAKLVYQIADIE
jgi:ABC-type multidrug transport system ATPase subunit